MINLIGGKIFKQKHRLQIIIYFCIHGASRASTTSNRLETNVNSWPRLGVNSLFKFNKNTEKPELDRARYSIIFLIIVLETFLSLRNTGNYWSNYIHSFYGIDFCIMFYSVSQVMVVPASASTYKFTASQP